MKPQRGFSLVEIMVVLVILGLTVTFATLGFQRLENDRLETQAGRISAWLQGVSDNAVLDSAVYGVWLSPGGDYLQSGFFLDNRWWLVDSEEGRSEALDGELVILVAESGQWRALRKAPAGEALQPDIVFLPSGLALPERFEVRDPAAGRAARIERDEDGLYGWSLL